MRTHRLCIPHTTGSCNPLAVMGGTGQQQSLQNWGRGQQKQKRYPYLILGLELIFRPGLLGRGGGAVVGFPLHRHGGSFVSALVCVCARLCVSALNFKLNASGSILNGGTTKESDSPRRSALPARIASGYGDVGGDMARVVAGKGAHGAARCQSFNHKIFGLFYGCG